jgi:PAS domain S-box-containing protein
LALKNQQSTLDLRHQAALLDLTPDAIIVRDGDDVITYWNARAEEEYGWTSEQAVGRRATELLKTKFPDTHGRIGLQLHAADRWAGELTHTKRDGTEVVVASRWSLQRDERGRPGATMEINNDITERKRADEKLRQAEQELRDAIDTIPGMVWSASAADDRWFCSTRAGRTWVGQLPKLPRANGNPWCILMMRNGSKANGRGRWRPGSLSQPYVVCDRRRANIVGSWRAHRHCATRTAKFCAGTASIHRGSPPGRRCAPQDAGRACTCDASDDAGRAHGQPLAAIVTNGEACLHWLLRNVPDLDEVRAPSNK